MSHCLCNDGWLLSCHFVFMLYTRDSVGGQAQHVCLSICLSLCLSVCLSICVSVCLSVCLSVYLLVCLSVCLFACLSVCLSICLSVCLSVYLLVCLSVCLFACLSVCLSACLKSASCPDSVQSFGSVPVVSHGTETLGIPTSLCKLDAPRSPIQVTLFAQSS